MRKECWGFIKEKRDLLSRLVAALLLLGVSGMVLFPHVMQQWSHDRKVGVLHIASGMLTGAMGLIFLFLLLKYLIERRDEEWKRRLVHLFLWYLAIQMISGIVQGVLGLWLYQSGILTYQVTKTAIYMITGVWQNLLRVWFLFQAVVAFYGGEWRHDKKVIGHAELVALLLSAVTLGLAVLENGLWQNAVRVVWEVLFLTGFTIYFGMRQRRRQINEKDL